MSTKEPEIVYHYCSPETFFNIVKNNSIRLSEISKSNDSQELRWINNQCRKHVESYWREHSKLLSGDDRSADREYYAFQEVNSLLRKIENNETMRCWAFCLSELDDDLGQWRGYAKDGQGVSIGFKADYLKSIEMPLESGDNAGTLMRFGKVNYGERAARKMLRDESTKRGDGVRPKKEIAIHTMLSAVIGSLANAPFFKSNAFKQEREWRLIAYLSMLELKKGVRPDKHGNELSPGGSITYDYTIKNDDLVSHLELKSESLHEQISLIRLGPKCNCSVDEVKLFLMSKGWLKHINDESILVRASEASYR